MTNRSEDEGRHLPNDPEVERCVIGSMLLGNKDDRVEKRHFLSRVRGAIFSAIQSLWDGGVPVDAVLVAREISRRGWPLDAVELGRCMDATPNPDHLQYYAGELVNIHKRRMFIKAAEWLMEKAYDPTADVDKCWKKLRDKEL